MLGANKQWSHFACYAVALGTSLVLQVVRPDLFAMLCTPLPVGESLTQPQRLAVPLNSPVLSPTERIK